MGKRFDGVFTFKMAVSERLHVTTAEMILVFLLSAAAILSRCALLNNISGDYSQFLSVWFDSLKSAGGLPGIGLSLGDYTPPYIYVLSFLTYLPLSSLYSIKLVSILFDFVLAIAGMRAVYLSTGSKTHAVGAYTALLFAPTVLMNGSFWGQCDGIFTAFLLLSLVCYMQDRPLAGTILFAVSFCFKLQAIFFAPLLVFLWLKNRIRLRHFLAIPAVYLLSILPAWIAGRPFSELLTIYISQSGQYSRISLNAPNLYIFIHEDTSEALSVAAVFLCGALVLFSLYLLWHVRFPVTKEVMLTVALYFCLLIPFFLPHMHERYFYTADALAVLYAFCRPKRAIVPLLTIGASTAAYLPFLFGHEPFDLRIAALMMFAALIFVARDLWALIQENRKQEKHAV